VLRRVTGMSEPTTDRPEGIVRYRISPRVNPTQARLAWEDVGTWAPGFLLAYDGETATVAMLEDVDLVPQGSEGDAAPSLVDEDGLARGGFDLAETSTDGLPVGGLVWVTERWSILAFPDEHGNAIARLPASRMVGSLFILAGAGRLRFLLARVVDDPVEQEADPEELVYGTVTGLDGVECFLINRRADAEYAAEIMEVIGSCSTWGEVRELASLDLYDELLSRCGYGTLDDYLQHLKIGVPIPGAFDVGAEAFDELGHTEFPDDDDAFDAMGISGYQDGDFPPAPDWLQEQLLPRSLAAEYGRAFETVFNGTYLELPPESGSAIVAAMEALGYRCVEDPRLFTAAFRF
jgi:hypothetical protein